MKRVIFPSQWTEFGKFVIIYLIDITVSKGGLCQSGGGGGQGSTSH